MARRSPPRRGKGKKLIRRGKKVDLDDLVWPPAEDASEQAGQVGGHR